MKYWMFFLLVILFTGCAKVKLKKPLYKRVSYYQFGDSFFFPKLGSKDIKGSKKVCQTSSGMWVWPKSKCVLVKGTKVCLTPVPKVYPHIKITRVDSSEVQIKILSIFSEVGLFISDRKYCPEFNTLRIVKGAYSLKNPKLGKTYFILGGVHIGSKIFGPLSKPIKVVVKDETPPEPPKGGGYLIFKNTLKLMWEKSPSPDVVHYEVQCGNYFKITKTNIIKLTLVPGMKWCKIYAIDRAGNRSKPFVIKIIKIGEDNNEEKGVYSH